MMSLWWGEARKEPRAVPTSAGAAPPPSAALLQVQPTASLEPCTYCLVEECTRFHIIQGRRIGRHACGITSEAARQHVRNLRMPFTWST